MSVKQGLLIAAIISVLFSSCSTLRKNRSSDEAGLTGRAGLERLTAQVIENNVGRDGYEIKKGRIENIGGSVSGTFNFYARVSSRNDLYLSVRGPLSVEIVRVIAVDDKIYIINRLSKEILVSDKSRILGGIELPAYWPALLVGDLISKSYDRIITEGDDSVEFSSEEGDFDMDITLDKSELKARNIAVSSKELEKAIDFDFSHYREGDGIKYPGEVEIRDSGNMFHVKLYIQELISGNVGEIELSLPDYPKRDL